MSELQSRMLAMPKDATPEQIRQVYDDFAKTYDGVCSYIPILFSPLSNDDNR